ncbi:nuclear pore complex-interacting protein family member B15 isoform 1 [Homo sapiens]|uniref:nuclear pore complex-interacting protein family member B15 isoform 1 n=1 Tax=Homo sapiens TaxID=9606 RepID=UPI0015E3A9B2|nr:nuclear pore complex-interacting protein family member B15 isoform 1 [Homo sapiens]
MTLRNPGSSGRKESPEAGTGSWLGRTRNQVINSLAVYRHRETDFGVGVRDHPGQHGKTPSPQKLDNLIIIIIGFLRRDTFTILFCTSYLCVSFLKTIFWSRNGHDGSTDVQQRAWRSNRSRQKGLRSICMHTKKRVSSFRGNKIGLKDVITLRRHVETKVRAKIRKRKVTTKINRHDKINGKRKTARKQKMFQRAQELRRRAEDYHKCKIPPSARKPLCNWVRMAAAEHRHSSGLPCWPYLTAEALKNRMGRQPPPPTQQHSITDNSLSLKTPPECLLHPLPPSVDDNIKECPLAPLPPSVDDNLKEYLLVPLPPSPLPPSVDDNLKDCLFVPLPPSPLPPSVDDNLKTPPLATQEAEAEKPPKPKRWRVDEVEQSPKPKRRRADEVEQSPKPKRQREAEAQQLPKPKRRRLSKLRTRHCTQAWAIRINPWVEKKKKIKKQNKTHAPKTN